MMRVSVVVVWGGCGGHQSCTVLVFCALLCPHMRAVTVAPSVFKNYVVLGFILLLSLNIIYFMSCTSRGN